MPLYFVPFCYKKRSNHGSDDVIVHASTIMELSDLPKDDDELKQLAELLRPIAMVPTITITGYPQPIDSPTLNQPDYCVFQLTCQRAGTVEDESITVIAPVSSKAHDLEDILCSTRTYRGLAVIRYDRSF